jgi:tetratricopeptide (TPR) repeat protein
MIEGAIQRRNGQLGEAISTLDEAIDVADLWRIRFERARAYLDDGSFADALDEFERCEQRRGEATAMFLDDIPTFRYLAELPSLLARTRERLP